jgi:hypothetical protein
VIFEKWIVKHELIVVEGGKSIAGTEKKYEVKTKQNNNNNNNKIPRLEMLYMF